MENDYGGDGDMTVRAWGYWTGSEWSYKAKRGIKQIIIRYGGIIDSIMFKDDNDNDCSADNSIKFGGDGGSRTDKIYIDFPSEFLTGIHGTYGRFWTFGHHICSLRFQTNRTEYGPFGTEGGTPFSFQANGGVITGFHGRAGQFLDAIGVYLKPNGINVEKKEHSEISELGCVLPGSAGPWGSANGGREWDDGVFSTVKLAKVHLRSDTGVVIAVRFGYEKRDGTAFVSPMHGGGGGGGGGGDIVKKIAIDGVNEFLIGIEGFCGPVEGVSGLNVVTSLTFHTNKGKYGPMGAEIGTYFTSMSSSMATNGKVVGFHGRSSAYLDAIGVHTEYF